MRQQIVSDTRTQIELKNGLSIEILANDFRSVRGYSLAGAIIDEVAFIQTDTSSNGSRPTILNDDELIGALRPGLATLGGKLIAISSPYAKKGWCYKTYKRCFGNNQAKTLVWTAPSRTMNPTLSQAIVDEALEEDSAKARSEFLAQFRDDISTFIPRDVVEAAVIQGRRELMPRMFGQRYFAFADVSGGRRDDAALAIAHKNNNKIIIDTLQVFKAPFNPNIVISKMCETLKRYGLSRLTGDNYAANFVSHQFKSNRIHYKKAELNKSKLYLELLPMLCSGDVELLDNPTLINQLANLERRTRSGGNDIVDHSQGGHDDLANAVAGVAYIASQRKTRIGSF